MMTSVGLTSRWMAAQRARESETEAPLFTDPYARALAGEEGFAFLAKVEAFRAGGPSDAPDPGTSIRTRFFDDAILAAARGMSEAQVVILAAGMDARAYRLEWPARTTVYEVDRQEIFDYKEPVLEGLGAHARCIRRVVSADLESDWVPLLDASGFDSGRPAAFLLEGLLVFLDEVAVTRLLAAVQRVAVEGSWLGADLLDVSLLELPHMEAFREEMARIGCAWRFGTREPESFLERYGWSATVTLFGEPDANFSRWPYPVRGRDQPGLPRVYLAVGERIPDLPIDMGRTPGT